MGEGVKGRPEPVFETVEAGGLKARSAREECGDCLRVNWRTAYHDEGDQSLVD